MPSGLEGHEISGRFTMTLIYESDACMRVAEEKGRRSFNGSERDSNLLAVGEV